LVGESQTIRVIPETIAFQAYGKESIVEKFQCNYGLNEKYTKDLNDGKLKITGFDMDGNARIIELPYHRFFIATLYLPQVSSELGSAHPLILSFIKSVIKYKKPIKQIQQT
jgi:CTP synthase (UTP-ammonia lyase)